MTIYQNQQATNVWPVAAPITAVTYEEDDIYLPMELDEFMTDRYISPRMNPVQQRMSIILGFVLVGAFLFVALAIPRMNQKVGATAVDNSSTAVDNSNLTGFGALASTGKISPLFTKEVQYWEAHITKWAADHNLNPNMVATVMQIESCGDPNALSIAGAQGLFQVMPFHLQSGEDGFNPDTNAYRGMSFLADLLGQFGEPGLSFAGYNGGPGTAMKSWENWPNETQRYYRWATGIYQDAVAGHTESDTLNDWLAAGGAGGCARAAAQLGLN